MRGKIVEISEPYSSIRYLKFLIVFICACFFSKLRVLSCIIEYFGQRRLSIKTNFKLVDIKSAPFHLYFC